MVRWTNWPSRFAVLALVLGLLAGGGLQAVAQEATPEAGQPAGIDEVAPAPASVGSDIPVTYFGPPPSEVQKELVGPVELLRAGEIDMEAGTFTLPLYRGAMEDGTPVWYILTDTTDESNAEALGLNHSAKLAYAGVEGGTRTGTLNPDLSMTFEQGTVDFAPERTIEPGTGENPFPPTTAEPGSVGDDAYTPLVTITNAGGHVYNAPILAFGNGAEELGFCEGPVDHALVHDRVTRFCPDDMTVTMRMVAGFSFARPVFYVSFDASDPLAATLEEATLAPAMNNLRVGFDDGAFSAVERLFVTANGPTGSDNPQRQGLNSALLGEGTGPLNVFGGVPTIALDYSPMWDLNLGFWTEEAIDAGYRSRVIDEFQILGLAEQGHITGPEGAAYGSTGIIVNCPIIARLL
ncbi:MAG: hypothetical protein AVDCRST_MAG19-2560 [uncultured Thermomicrobiales bacterium]|uniref:Uncharacterized protein n=1 Tax=uncultured Thermomicrobiales bacterium TaxID=1645740 RepID=A0A6J4V6T2_9BACT|nr:MAG: hypothetical protein AVDCRST_MAG19-2560 [uncultured Thermomicrobiales bacterium]